MATTTSSPEAILDAVGGPGNIAHLTHCATRLRFELNDASIVDTPTVEKIPGVMGAVPQSGNRYQIIIGGTVQSMYESIMALPAMKDAGATTGSAAKSNDEIKAAARASGIRGRFAWVDSFFEFLSDSFRPLIGALLGASIFITFMALMGTLGVIGNWADSRVTLEPTWAYLNLTWRAVFYFLPLMVAYNASKKLGADPWVGFAVMGFTMLPGFAALGLTDAAHQITFLGSEITQVTLFGHLPLTIFDYNSQVFPPLLMAAVLGPLTKWLKKVVPADVQLIFVPFIAMLIMIPLTSFILGPIGVYVGAGLSKVLLAINNVSPFIFCLLIPLAYPFMVPLGLHWPINAVMLLNIQQNGFDFIQGPMGAWNFACFGATAGVLVLAVRHKEKDMRVTATGALFAGLVGGISEPSLYGIHLRYKLIYKRMLVGCFAGGVVIAVLGWLFPSVTAAGESVRGVTTNAFAFTSLLTIPVFSQMWVYAVSIAVSFIVSMVLIIMLDYRTPEQKAEMNAASESDGTAVETAPADAAPVATATATATATAVRTTTVGAPVAGHVVSLDDAGDPVFASRALGEGVGIQPTDSTVVAPVSGVLQTVAETGHAFGLKTDDGIEVLVHVGIDTVKMNGEGFHVAVSANQRVNAGDTLVTVDFDKVKEAGYSTTTLMTVLNTAALAGVTPKTGVDVQAGQEVLDIQR